MKPFRINRGFEIKAALPVRALEQMAFGTGDHDHGAIYAYSRDHSVYVFLDRRDVSRLLFPTARRERLFAARAMGVSIAVREATRCERGRTA